MLRIAISFGCEPPQAIDLAIPVGDYPPEERHGTAASAFA
jgi:hypothetical protein